MLYVHAPGPSGYDARSDNNAWLTVRSLREYSFVIYLQEEAVYFLIFWRGLCDVPKTFKFLFKCSIY